MTLLNKFVFILVSLALFVVSLSECPKGYFKLESMKYCFPWLKCKDISRVIITDLIGYGSTKMVYRALWGNRNVTLMKLKNIRYRYDFYSGLNVLITLNPNSHVVQLLGFCVEKDIIITEYHKFNNALFFNVIRDNIGLKESFNFCYSYAKIISFLHNSPMGTLVNCDSNDLTKLLSQLLITGEFNLVLGDVDALPEVRANSSISCGRNEIRSDFVAPEQLWNRPGKFNIKLMKGYDEKTDIWKTPDVCLFFLKDKMEVLQYSLFHIHLQCKDLDPSHRPSAKELVESYQQILSSL